MKKYRVLETQGRFYIQIEVEQLIQPYWPLPYWRTVKTWAMADTKGGFDWGIERTVKPFDSLEDAMEQIEIFNTPDKIHYV